MNDTDDVAEHFRLSRETLDRAATPDFIATVAAIATTIAQSLRNGGKLLIAGNGGSAADAQHIAGELTGRLNYDRGPLPAIALAADIATLTAIGNDYGFEHLFERQVRAFGKAGDVLLAISTSGRSPNILAALKAARVAELKTVGFTGAGGDMKTLCDLCLAVPSANTQQIQQIYMVAAHAICGLVEKALFPS
jgi:D-sedoheptulose 7-phosphate isomerase